MLPVGVLTSHFGHLCYSRKLLTLLRRSFMVSIDIRSVSISVFTIATNVQIKEQSRYLSPRRRCFDPSLVCVGFVVDKLALGQLFFLEYFRFPSQCHFTNNPYAFIRLPPTRCNLKQTTVSVNNTLK
jgi:hypothetical protein